jgi:hypothetical protein
METRGLVDEPTLVGFVTKHKMGNSNEQAIKALVNVQHNLIRLATAKQC